MWAEARIARVVKRDRPARDDERRPRLDVTADRFVRVVAVDPEERDGLPPARRHLARRRVQQPDVLRHAGEEEVLQQADPVRRPEVPTARADERQEWVDRVHARVSARTGAERAGNRRLATKRADLDDDPVARPARELVEPLRLRPRHVALGLRDPHEVARATRATAKPRVPVVAPPRRDPLPQRGREAYTRSSGSKSFLYSWSAKRSVIPAM